MFKYCFRIAEKTICFFSDAPLLVDTNAAKFMDSNKTDPLWICYMKTVESLPKREKTIVAGETCSLSMSLDRFSLYSYDRLDQNEFACFSYSTIQDRNQYVFLKKGMGYLYDQMNKIWPIIDLPYIMLNLGAVILHSSCIEYHDKAILFCGPSHIGKSTQARLWEKYKSAVCMNGDKNAITIIGGEAYACGVPFCGTSGICENYRLPLAGIVLLSQSQENIVTEMNPIDAFSQCIKNIFGFSSLPGWMENVLNVLLPIIKMTKVYHMACTPDENAVAALERSLKG